MSINSASTICDEQQNLQLKTVGSYVTIQPDNLSPRQEYLAYARGKIEEINGNIASVLLDEPLNHAYKPHVVNVQLSSLILADSEEVNEEKVITPSFDSGLQIDSEFKNLIPPLSVEEKLQLEANLKEFGCIDPLVVWKDKSILLDGHNRYDLCTKNQISYKIVEIDMVSRDAAICWIVNNQLGRRNTTPEVASYLRGKRYLHLRGNREDNLKQNSSKCKTCTSEEEVEDAISMDKAKSLAAEYKVSPRTIKNDAKLSQALDCLGDALGEKVKHSILSRSPKMTKEDILSLAQVVHTQGSTVAQQIFDNKQGKTSIVQQIKDKQRVPNPRIVGEVCQIISKGDPDLKQYSGCWCIINAVNLHSCAIRMWKMDLPTVKPENLEPIYTASEEIADRNSQRIRRLADKVYRSGETTHIAVLEALSRIHDPASLTTQQERILSFLEGEYDL
ncbi:hypothetical protein [Calothrix sp. CCY 0018]|uniref:hypothetical protein n=1 Tax=Calothrix sp. CCY 0018 TaxID=3103864 RepID=UPI0039C741B2